MAYVALYRAYRPQKFSEVVGQRHIVKTLQNAIRLNKVAHAYLFTGPRGTGKTTLAKIMAKALNCEQGMVEDPCCECDICKGIAKGSIGDVVEMDAASNNSVDDIRDIVDKVKLMPGVGRYRVYIIDEVHMLSTSAFNALLKTLEEPPSYCVFILCTTDPQKIPQTILSRCQRFDFQGISPEDVKYNIKNVAEKENIEISQDAIDLISEACEGGMRDALGMLDQSISFSKDGKVDLNAVLAISGSTSKKQIIELINACKESNQDEVIKIINSIISEGKEIEKITSDIIGFLRDLLMYKSDFGNKAIYNDPDFQKLASIKNGVIYSWLEELNKVQNNIKFTNQKRAYLELGLLKMGDKDLNDYSELVATVSELEARLTALERRKPEVIKTVEPEKPQVRVQPVSQIKSFVEPKPEARPEVKIEAAPKANNDFIESKDIVEIFNNGDKAYKQELKDALSQVEAKDPFNPLFTMMGTALFNAASNGVAVLVVESASICNRLMRDENYDKFIEMIRSTGTNLDAFYAIPRETFNTLTKEFMAERNNPDYKVDWDAIKIPVNKHQTAKQAKDEFEELAGDFFGEENIEIK